jgi:hypothetical protein
LDCSPHHVRKAWLLTSFFNLVHECEIFFTKNADQFWTAPGGNRVELGSGSNNIKPVATELE